MTIRLFVIGVLLGVSQAALVAQEPVSQPPSTAAVQSQRVAAETKFVWKEYPSIRSGRFRIDFRARFAGDVRSSESLTDATDNVDDRFDIARRRIGVAGSFGDVVEFQVERELANDVPWR